MEIARTFMYFYAHISGQSFYECESGRGFAPSLNLACVPRNWDDTNAPDLSKILKYIRDHIQSSFVLDLIVLVSQ